MYFRVNLVIQEVFKVLSLVHGVTQVCLDVPVLV